MTLPKPPLTKGTPTAVTFCVVPSLRVAVTLIGRFCPTAREILLGVIVRDEMEALVTVTVADATGGTTPIIAEMVAAPGFRAVTTPCTSTMATFVSDETHAAVCVRS
jgi:hypothetical protein